MGKKKYERVILNFVELQDLGNLMLTSGLPNEAWDVGEKDVYGGVFLD